jgi:putative flippase GtrA
MDRRFFRFALIGGLAFFVDALLYVLLGRALHLPWLQKVVGFTGGVTTTYLLNSAFTFRSSLSLSRYGFYVLSQLGGMAVNLAAFLMALRLVTTLPALFLATLAGLVVNFLGARRVLHRSAGPD